MSNLKKYSYFMKAKIFFFLFLYIVPFFYEPLISKEEIIEKKDFFIKDENFYLLDSGDQISVSFYGLPIYDSTLTIDPNGYINLPEINRIKVDGLTIRELEKSLTEKYSPYIINPKINIFIARYRPVSVYVNGEVEKKGLYTFNSLDYGDKSNVNSTFNIGPSTKSTNNQIISSGGSFPTIFDAIKNARGFTNYANISKIQIIRKNSISNGGGQIKTEVDFIKFLKNGDQSQNIRLFSGDIITIFKSDKVIKDQILIASNTNIAPDNVTVFVTGNVVKSGQFNLKRGTSLVEAIAATGGKKQLTGKIEFIRFNEDGETTKRKFTLNQNAPVNSKLNPILKSGDIINVNKTLLGSSAAIFQEVSTPILSGIGLYKIFN